MVPCLVPLLREHFSQLLKNLLKTLWRNEAMQVAQEGVGIPALPRPTPSRGDARPAWCLPLVQSWQPGAWHRLTDLSLHGLCSPWGSGTASGLPQGPALMPHHPGAGGGVSPLQPHRFCPSLHKPCKMRVMRANVAPSHQDTVVSRQKEG